MTDRHRSYSLIVAYDKNRLIGREGDLPWRGSLPADLQYFREKTIGNIILMGRTTYESIGRPLPNRETRVLSRDKNYNLPDVKVFNNPDDALTQEQEDKRKIYIAGGSEVYKLFLPMARQILATEIDASFHGDTYFPEIDPSEWVLTHANYFIKDDKNLYDYCFKEYTRRSRYIDVSKARNEAQEKQFSQIEVDAVCPFCVDNLETYHTKPILEKSERWVITENMVPYENTKKHLLVISVRHVEHIDQLDQEDWVDLGKLLSKYSNTINSGGLAMRFGDFMKNAASVNHLHIHLLEPNSPLGIKENLKFKISR